MNNYTLFIFEGVKTEKNIASSMIKHFMIDTGHTPLLASYGHCIYQLYSELKNNDGKSIFGILCDQLRKRSTLQDDEETVLSLEETDLDAISDIYLLFDYDPHNGNASDIKLNEMLALFDDSMDNGLLCISYPMVEALRHQPAEDSIALTHPTSDLTGYKGYLNQKDSEGNFLHLAAQYHNWGLYEHRHWSELTRANLRRANHLVHGMQDLPADQLSQADIFAAQQQRHLPGHIRVLSAFPLMLHNYYGTALYDKLTSQ